MYKSPIMAHYLALEVLLEKTTKLDGIDYITYNNNDYVISLNEGVPMAALNINDHTQYYNNMLYGDIHIIKLLDLVKSDYKFNWFLENSKFPRQL